MTGISIVVGAIGTTPKGLVKSLEDLEIRGHVATIKTTLSKSAIILKRVKET